MDARIECSICHRVERWLPDGVGFRKEVVLEGGSRRPAVHPQWARGLTALKCVDDPSVRVAGPCPACGQLMLTEAHDVPSVPVEVGTPRGTLAIADDEVIGPTGDHVSPDDARRFLEEQYEHAEDPDLADQLIRAPLFTVVCAVFSALALGLVFVGLFIAAVLAGGAGIGP